MNAPDSTMSAGQKLREINWKEYTSIVNVSEAMIY